MEKFLDKPTKTKRVYKKRKLEEKQAARPISSENPRGDKDHCYKAYRKRTGTAGLVQDTWKRLKDRWVNEERDKERASKITRYFSISIEEHEKGKLASLLAEEAKERSELPLEGDEEALAPDEQPPIANL